MSSNVCSPLKRAKSTVGVPLISETLCPLELMASMLLICTANELTLAKGASVPTTPRPGLVHHSDQGMQYAAAEYAVLLAQHRMTASMSRPGNPYDNAPCESFIKTLKQEEIYCHQYRDREDLRLHLREFIEEYHKRCRLHSALGYRTPAEFEAARPTGSATTSLAASMKLSFPGRGRSI